MGTWQTYCTVRDVWCGFFVPPGFNGHGIAGRADGGRFCRASPLAMVHAGLFSQPSALPFAIGRPPRSSPFLSTLSTLWLKEKNERKRTEQAGLQRTPKELLDGNVQLVDWELR